MRRPWYRANPDLLDKLEREVRSIYPNLHFYPEKDRVLIRGSFPIIHGGKILDRYLLEIELLPDYPESIPIVRETGGRIPRTLDHHINNPAGEICLFLPDERCNVYPLGSTFLDFLNGPLRNYFIGESLVEFGQPWPFGQWSHGAEGILEYYSNLLGTKDLAVILKYLEYLSKPKLKGHWDCPCGSGEPLRNCHFKELIDISLKIPPEIAEQSRSRLLSFKKP